MGSGAPVTYARLHDYINIGSANLGDPVDQLVQNVSDQIGTLVDNLGNANDTEPDPPNDPGFKAWAKLFVDAMHATYDPWKPTNLSVDYLLNGRTVQRADGYPVPDDIAAAYGAFRLLLRIGTEEKVKDPEPPSISSDISAAIAKINADIAAALAGTAAPPPLFNGPAFSIDAILDAIEKTFEWAAQAAAATATAAFKFIDDAIAAGVTVAVDSIRYALWLASKTLYGMYRVLRDMLTLRAYAIPYTDQLDINIGALATSSLWQSMGNPPRQDPNIPAYPHEETLEQEKMLASGYTPIQIPQTGAELPGFDFVAPYSPASVRVRGAGTITIPARPDAFIDEQRPGPRDNMFDADAGPQSPIATGFDFVRKDYGPAMDNCRTALDAAMRGAPLVLPNYNLDGDRTYGWLCWNVDQAADKLNPYQNRPSMIATVNAKGI